MQILRLADWLRHRDWLRVRCHDGRVVYVVWCSGMGGVGGVRGVLEALAYVRFLQAALYATKKYWLSNTVSRAPNKLTAWLSFPFIKLRAYTQSTSRTQNKH